MNMELSNNIIFRIKIDDVQNICLLFLWIDSTPFLIFRQMKVTIHMIKD